MKARHGALPLVICAACLGCGPAAVPESAKSGQQASGREKPDPHPPAAEQIRLDVRSWDEIQQWVAEQQGRIVVLDLWNSWCGPCLREFPELVALQRQHVGRLVCGSVNLDYTGSPEQPPAALRDKVHGFLKKQHAAFQHMLCSDPDLTVLGRLKLGAVPAVLVYDRTGRLRQRFDNDDQQYGEAGFTYREHVASLIEKLAAEP